jgi:hypothetical protein
MTREATALRFRENQVALLVEWVLLKFDNVDVVEACVVDAG